MSVLSALPEEQTHPGHSQYFYSGEQPWTVQQRAHEGIDFMEALLREIKCCDQVDKIADVGDR